MIAVLLVLAMFVGQAQAAPPTPPPDFVMKSAESSPGPVTFSHGAHLAKGVRCSACHMRDFRMKRGESGPITLEAKQQGKFCGACHDGKTSMGGAAVFPIDECERCHKN